MIRRVVFDTNVIVSALLFENGSVAWLRESWARRVLIPVACRETIAELVHVFSYPKFQLSVTDRDELLADFLPYVEVFDVGRASSAELPGCRDPNDEIFLHLAIAAKVDTLVSGDADLLTLDGLLPLPILTPAALRTALETP